MNNTELTLLDLGTLANAVELSRPVSEALALAASVVLVELHGPRETIAASLRGEHQTQSAEIRRVAVDDVARSTYADPQEAAEEGAEGIGLLTARQVFDRIVFRRLPKGTGADYLMRPPESTDGDLYERLKCSGIGRGQESAASRLRTKLNQLARYGNNPPGRAVVTDFSQDPVDIMFGTGEGRNP